MVRTRGLAPPMGSRPTESQPAASSVVRLAARCAGTRSAHPSLHSGLRHLRAAALRAPRPQERIHREKNDQGCCLDDICSECRSNPDLTALRKTGASTERSALRAERHAEGVGRSPECLNQT